MAALFRTVLVFAVALVMSTAAFSPAPLGLASMRTQRATCGLFRMQTSADADVVEPQLSRAQRRMQEKMSKKNTDGTVKATQQATGGMRVKKGQKQGPPPNLVDVAYADDVPPEDGGRKSVDLPESKQSLMLMRYKNKVLGMAAQCTRCKFPLVGATYEKVEEGGKEHDALTCKVCGTGYKLPNGEVVESKGTLLSGLFSKTVATRLPVFATLIKEGKVMMGIAPKEPAA